MSKIKEITKGSVYSMKDCVYQQLLVLSDKRTTVVGGVSRECVAWNQDRCRRYDMTEQEIGKLQSTAQLDEHYVDEYVMENKKNEWENPKPPM